MAGNFWSMFQPSAAPAQAQSSTSQNQQSNSQNSSNQNNQQGQQGQSGQQSNEPGNRPANAATLPQNNTGGQGNGNDTNATPQQNKNPLDTYSSMFENKASSGDSPPTFSIDPKQMDTIVQGLDFTKGIDPAVMTKATQGDANALLEIIQGVGRNSYRAAIEHGGVLTDKFVGAREQHSGKSFSSKVRKELVTNQLASNTPNFQHPVVRQQLTEIAQRFQTQHPDATAKEIGDMSVQYLQDLMDAIRPPDKNQQQNSSQNSEVRGEEFWNDYFSENQPST